MILAAISLHDIWPAGAMMVALGAVFALVLLIASIKLHVEVDPKVEQVHEALPNIDCGVCGFGNRPITCHGPTAVAADSPAGS